MRHHVSAHRREHSSEVCSLRPGRLCRSAADGNADEGRASVRLEAGADYMLPGNAPAAACLHEADRLCKFLQLVPGNPSTDGFERLPTGMHIRGKWPEITIDHDAVIFWGARCRWFESSRPDQFLSSGATPSAVEAVAPTTFLLPLSTITISGKTPGHVHRADARNRWLESAAFSTDIERYSRQRWIELQGEA